jgi:hypothetical protein
MNYRTTLFWGGVVLLDYFLLMGLPTHHSMLDKQSRIQPSHCWESESPIADLENETAGVAAAIACRRTGTANMPARSPVSGVSAPELMPTPVSEFHSTVDMVDQTLI